MNFKSVYITVPFLALVFLAFVLEFVFVRPIYCWMACLQPEISCLATLSFTFGLVPATTIVASSAISGCLASFDICELSCAKRSNLKPFSAKGNISNSCEIFRNGTKIKPIEIKSNWRLANPFNLDADCHELPEPTTTVPHPTTVTTQISMHHPHIIPLDVPAHSPTSSAANISSTEIKHPVIKNIDPPPK